MRKSAPQVVVFGDSTLDVQGLKSVLAENGYQTQLIGNPFEGFSGVTTEDLALIFLDVPYLDRSGIEVDSVINLCRSSTHARLIAMLAADRPQDFQVTRKVDDFIAYPYSRHEVLARVVRVLGGSPEEQGRQVLRRGEILIDLDRYEVWLDKRQVELTYKEYELLKFLASNPGKVYSREELLDKVWGYNWIGGTRTVDVHVRRLRSKIEDSRHSFIDTVRGVGYRFIPQE